MPKPLPSLEECEMPIPVPHGREWTMLVKLCFKVSDGPHHSPSYVSKDGGVPFLSTRNVRAVGFDLTTVKYVSHDDHAKFTERTKPQIGDILYTKSGTTGIARGNDLDFDFSIWVHVALLKIAQDELFPEFVAMALNSPLCYEQSQQYTQGSSNNDLGLTRMVMILMFLPPISEQKRIVVKVTHFLSPVTRLESTLTRRESTRTQLLTAAIHAMLNGDAGDD